MPSKALIGVSVVGHIALFTGMFVYNAWDLDRLEYRQRSDVRIGAPVPPPPESSGAEAPKVEMTRKQPKVKPPEEIVQVKLDKVVREEPPKETGDKSGDGEDTGGGGDGPPGSTCTGDGCGPVPQDVPAVPEPPKPPPPPVCPGDPRCPPVVLKPTVFAALRQRGKIHIHPPSAVQHQMVRDDMRETSAAVRICLTTSGSIASAAILRSTKYADYDAEILREVRQWQYSPYTVNGKPVPACSMVHFQYSMK